MPSPFSGGESSGFGDSFLTNPRGEKYTIVVPTYRRPDLITEFVAHHSKCPGIDAIRIVWNDVDQPPTVSARYAYK
jgi:hypothetical protein